MVSRKERGEEHKQRISKKQVDLCKNTRKSRRYERVLRDQNIKGISLKQKKIQEKYRNLVKKVKNPKICSFVKISKKNKKIQKKIKESCCVP